MRSATDTKSKCSSSDSASGSRTQQYKFPSPSSLLPSHMKQSYRPWQSSAPNHSQIPPLHNCVYSLNNIPQKQIESNHLSGSNPKQVSLKATKRIEGLLNNPSCSSTNDNTKSHKVSAIVSNIVSRTPKAILTNSAQKYLVMPVLHSPSNRSYPSYIRYMLVNAASVRKSDASNFPNPQLSNQRTLTPRLIEPIRQRPNARHITQRTTFTIRSPMCTAMITATVDTVNKWMGCNRDILSKTLVGVAEKLNVATMVTILLIKHREAHNEHVAMKWIGIALMLLTKHRIKQMVGDSGSPVPSILYHMWNNLKSFFTVYEGCLQLVQQHRKTLSEDSVNSANYLNMEDNAFDSMIGHIFTAYTKNTGEELPQTSDLTQLDQFIEGLNDASYPQVKSKNQVCRDAHITTTMSDGPRTSADITNQYKRHVVWTIGGTTPKLAKNDKNKS